MWMMEAEDTNWSSESPSGVQIYENQEQPMSSKHHSEEEEDQEPRQDDDQIEEREKLFEKPLTPSDVGKLNRLVIPKHHAEKFFPLDSANYKKGLLLSFEDSMGKDWWFRYSYWNSSQSYVLTKGWSRFVKEKKLDAGDVVSFERRIGGERFYINWNRRQNSGVQPNPALWNRFLHSCYPKQNDQLFYLRAPDAGLCTVNAGEPVGNPSTPSRSKRLRLFGVNLDCSTEPVEPDGSDGGVQSGFKFVPTAGSSSSSSSMAIDFDL